MLVIFPGVAMFFQQVNFARVAVEHGQIELAVAVQIHKHAVLNLAGHRHIHARREGIAGDDAIGAEVRVDGHDLRGAAVDQQVGVAVTIHIGNQHLARTVTGRQIEPWRERDAVGAAVERGQERRVGPGGQAGD